MLNYFRPKGSRFGIAPVFVGTRITASLTASGADTFFIPLTNRLAKVLGLTVFSDTIAVGGGTITAILYKYDASATAAVALTAATDLKTLTTKQGRSVALLSTLTDAQRRMDAGDTLYVVCTQSGTVTTQPTNLCFDVELAVLE